MIEENHVKREFEDEKVDEGNSWEHEDEEVDEGISIEIKVIVCIVIALCLVGLYCAFKPTTSDNSTKLKNPTPLDNLVKGCGENMGWLIVSDNFFEDPDFAMQVKNNWEGFWSINVSNTMKEAMADIIDSANATRTEKKEGCYRFYKHSSYVNEYPQWQANLVPPKEMDEHKPFMNIEEGSDKKFMAYVGCNPQNYRDEKMIGNSSILCKEELEWEFPTPLDDLVSKCGESMGWLIVSDNVFEDPKLAKKFEKWFFQHYYLKSTFIKNYTPSMSKTMQAAMIDTIDSTNATRTEKKEGCYRFYKHSSFVNEYSQWLAKVVSPDKVDKERFVDLEKDDEKFDKFIAYMRCDPKYYRENLESKFESSLCPGAATKYWDTKDTVSEIKEYIDKNPGIDIDAVKDYFRPENLNSFSPEDMDQLIDEIYKAENTNQ